MGRIRTKLTKRLTRKMMGEAEFTADFEANKKLLDSIAISQSKKFRNIIAGYASKLAKAKKY
jgi:small subunit ribosomal protein S17e